MSCNGHNELHIRTLNGSYTFANQRYIDSHGESKRFVPVGESKGIRELIAYYAPDVSYRKLEDLLLRVTGFKQYSASHLPKKVLSESVSVANYLSSVTPSLQLNFLFVDAVDIYAKDSQEILYFDDAVGVKRQNEVRRLPWAEGTKSSATVQTDVVVLTNMKNESLFLSSAEANTLGLDLEDFIRLRLNQQNGNDGLPLVAVIDGARTIRLRIESLFGKSAAVILDWYHLQKKVWEHLSRLQLSKELKKYHKGCICYYLWHGRVWEALMHIDLNIQTTKKDIVEELLTYLQKHEGEICNYDKRKKAGKVIGSGKGEKANDLLVANRQKKKAMSWSEEGSNAITILQTAQTNQQWTNYWACAA